MAEEEQCVFCHIASGKIPTKKVYEDDKVAAVLDINPATPGHILLVPKQHASIMPQMSEEVVAHIGMVAKQLSHALIRALKIDGTSIFAANGVAAGQRAPHFLLHVIPRSQNDGVGLQPSHIKLDEKTMREVFNKLNVATAKQFGIEPKPRPPEKQAEKAEQKSPEIEQKATGQKVPEGETKPEKPASKLDDIASFLMGGK